MNKLNLGNAAALSAFVKGDMANALVASTPGGIEAQEAAGQQEFVKGESFPKEMWPTKEAFEKVGFQFGEEIDELFLTAKLPEGWSKKASDHSMHSDIVDDQGRERIHIFYKAAFYDRRADASMKRRYVSRTVYPSEDLGKSLQKGEILAAVVDSDTQIIFSSGPLKDDDYETRREWEKKAEAWLSDNYPDAKDPTAYWAG